MQDNRGSDFVEWSASPPGIVTLMSSRIRRSRHRAWEFCGAFPFVRYVTHHTRTAEWSANPHVVSPANVFHREVIAVRRRWWYRLWRRFFYTSPGRGTQPTHFTFTFEFESEETQ